MSKYRVFCLFVVIAALSNAVSSRAEEPRSRMVSEVLASLPKYEAEALPSTSPGHHEGILAMPRLEIKAPRVQPFSEREIQTKSGRSEYLRTRYRGASYRGQDPENSVVPNYAALMYRDDKRLEQKSQLRRISEASAREGGDDARRLSKDIKLMFIRRSDWRTEGMDRSLNHWRN